MAEVTGQPPVEYQSVSQPAEGQATAWAEKPQWGEPEPDAGPGVAQTLVAEFIGTFALVAVGELRGIGCFLISLPWDWPAA